MSQLSLHTSEMVAVAFSTIISFHLMHQFFKSTFLYQDIYHCRNRSESLFVFVSKTDAVVTPTILSMFYKSCIQSVLTFSFICWFGNVSQKDNNA